jgi:hypothetical protein
MVDDASETTVVSLETYVHAPSMLEPPNETAGGLTDWLVALYVTVTSVHVAADGVTRAISNVRTTFVAAK